MNVRTKGGLLASRWIERSLIGLGALILGWSAVVTYQTSAYQADAARRLDALIRGGAASQGRLATPAPSAREPRITPGPSTLSSPGPTGSLGATGSDSRSQAVTPVQRSRSTRTPVSRVQAGATASEIVGRLEIPSLRLSAMIAEGTEPRTLDLAIGHLRHSALPGERGRVALAGHRDSFFRKLEHVRKNDVVRIVTPDGAFAYRVAWSKVVRPDHMRALRSNASDLVLITCYPFRYVGTAPQRFIVLARQFDPPPGRAGRVMERGPGRAG